MATEPTKASPPLPAPPAPPRDVVAEANKKIAAVKTGNDPVRPLRYTWKFIGGTIGAALDGMARYGRKGLMVGAGIGILATIALGGTTAFLLTPLFACAAGGFLLGAGGGTLVGLLTGGMNAVGREYRTTVYAEDLVQRKNIQTHAKPNRQDYREAYRRQQLQNSYTTQQVLERTNENTRDYNTYWQDREADRRMAQQEKGLGF